MDAPLDRLGFGIGLAQLQLWELQLWLQGQYDMPAQDCNDCMDHCCCGRHVRT